MTEGTLARWLKKEGEPIKAGDVIAEIETDKATMEVEAVDEGVLGKILVADGTAGVKVNAPIAVLLEDGEDAAVRPPPPARRPAPAPAAAAAARCPAPPRRAAHGPLRPSPAGRQRARRAGRRRVRLPAGPAHGQAGRHRPGRHEGQRPERPHRPRRHRGRAGRRAGTPSRAAAASGAGRPRRSACRRPAPAPRPAATARSPRRTARAQQHHAEGDRAPAVGEPSRPSRISTSRWTSRSTRCSSCAPS